MRIELYHASKFGNGAMVAEEFKRLMAGKGIAVNTRHIRDASPKAIPPADLYVFSSPGRMGKPIRGMRSFLKRLKVQSGSRFALLATEMNPKPDKGTGTIPKEEELGRCQRVLPMMRATLEAKGLKQVADGKIYVIGIKGPLEEGWREKVEAFADVIVSSSNGCLQQGKVEN